MGHIKLVFSYVGEIKPNTLLSELESGITFTEYTDHCDVVVPKVKGNNWHSYKVADNQFILHVSDDIFCPETIFNMILTNYIYNLDDFADLTLEDIDFSNSQYKDLVDSNHFILNEQERPIFGTIIKPYHMSVEDRVEFVKHAFGCGFTIVKEDETHLVSRNQILEESKLICQHVPTFCYYIPNITSHIDDDGFINQLGEIGVKAVLVNICLVGFQAINKLKTSFSSLGIWGHRVGFSIIEKRISVRAFSKIATLAGVDFVHIGTPLTADQAQVKLFLINEMKRINPNVQAVFSKLSPETFRLIAQHDQSNSINMICGYLREQNTDRVNWDTIKHFMN
ncbi:MAG: RuBisCO large subunit C-terminal-like domain-containing protein [Candidatus Cloacimonetes bacterium]|jgi:ribulose 1,5-bisphosphate carboxylase large subunit-like protein|nr:RuBisCO large subunit C-terminal-like domain-containing protein [Candidatus Cloacimonadota bacterium]